jgi:hypothetical protein
MLFVINQGKTMSKNILTHREAAHVLSDMLIASGFKKANVWDKEKDETRINIKNGFIIVSPRTRSKGQVRVFGDDIENFKKVIEDFNFRFTVVGVAKREMVLQRGLIY